MAKRGITPTGQGSEQLKNRNYTPCWTVLDSKDNPIQIEYAKRNVPYFCTDCGNPMIPKMGDIISHHFAHKPNDDGTPISCGGEGYRHFRVKSFTHKILSSIARSRFKFDVDILMEKSYGQDIPDISIKQKPLHGVLSDDLEILAIEIVDTHPPSDEKRKRWGDTMLEIKITDWSDSEIGNSATLSGLIVPWLVGFDKLIGDINEEITNSSIAIEKIKEEREKRVESYENETSKQIEKMIQFSDIEKSNKLTGATMPSLWFGTWTKLNDHEILSHSKSQYGVWIETEEHKQPKSGDWAFVRASNGSYSYTMLGEKISMKNWLDFSDDDVESKMIHRFYTVRRSRPLPEIKELVKNGTKVR